MCVCVRARTRKKRHCCDAGRGSRHGFWTQEQPVKLADQYAGYANCVKLGATTCDGMPEYKLERGEH